MLSRVLKLLKQIPIEVYPLGFAIVGISSFATFRFYKMAKAPEVIFRKADKDKWDSMGSEAGKRPSK